MKRNANSQPNEALETEKEFALERYKNILEQIRAVNENVYRFLAIYQALATSLVGAGIALFIGYRKWGISPSVARAGIVGLMWLVTIVALFTILLIVTGALNWLDYRREECELTDSAVRPGFRRPPQPRNFWRWYETYIVLFIAMSMIFLWSYTFGFILPVIR